MKKNNLFKAVGIVILIYILMSWIVPIIYGIAGAKTDDVSTQIGFVSILSVILETFSGFGTVVLYVLLVGAFYGVLKVTGAYDKVMELLSEKSKGKDKYYGVEGYTCDDANNRIILTEQANTVGNGYSKMEDVANYLINEQFREVSS